MFSPQSLSLDGPLMISVCSDNQFNYTRAADLGYRNQVNYLSGKMNNRSFLSWTGQTENVSLREFVKFIYRGTQGTNFNVLPHLTGNLTGNIMDKFLIPYGLCQTFEGKLPSYMAIGMPDTDAFSYNIFISDTAAATTFQLPYSLLSGDRVLVKQSEIGSWAEYKIKITENIVETNDGTCVDYPNGWHKSYSDCIDAELQDKMMPVLGCTVPWMSDVNTCPHPVPRLAKHTPLIKWISDIALVSWGDIEYRSEFCLPPCLVLSFHANRAPSVTSAKKDSAIGLYFQEQIEIKKIVLAYDATSLLVEVGSCLGLWLGLSVLGLFDTCTLFLMKMKWGATGYFKRGDVKGAQHNSIHRLSI